MKLKFILKNAFPAFVGLYSLLQVIYWTPERPKLEALQVAKYLQKQWIHLKSKNLVSGAIIIQQGDIVVFSEGNLDRQYPVGSISKSFAGYMIYEMQKQGFDADQKVCRWLSNFCKDTLNQITINHLLQHKSGLGRDIGLKRFLKNQFGKWHLSDIDTTEISKDDLKAEPGKKMIYSNFGFLVLSRVLEIIHQKNFSLLVSELAQKEGLPNTSLHKMEDTISRQLLFPFVSEKHLTITTKSSLHTLAGAGGVLSSAHDMIGWLDVLNKSDFNQTVFGKIDGDYSHGWMRSKKQSFLAYWHNGATIGTYSLIAYIPKTNTKIVILTNNYKPAKQWSIFFDELQSPLY